MKIKTELTKQLEQEAKEAKRNRKVLEQKARDAARDAKKFERQRKNELEKAAKRHKKEHKWKKRKYEELCAVHGRKKAKELLVDAWEEKKKENHKEFKEKCKGPKKHLQGVKHKITPENAEASRAKLMVAAAAQLKKQILEARRDCCKFIEFVMRTPKGERITLEPFHREWVERMLKSRRLQIEAAKSHGKTTISLGVLLYIIGNNTNIRIKLFTQSEDKARERLTVISNMITSNKMVRLVFPHLRPHPKGPWHKIAITVDRDSNDKDPTLEASGIMGSVEGGRADLVWFDDISDFRTSLIYPQHREAIKKKVYAEILPMLEEDGRAVSVGTPHHELDVVASLRKNPQWESHIYAAGTPEDPFVPLWPGRWPRLALMRLQEEIGPLEYDRAYRCVAISSAIAIVQPEHIKYYDGNMMTDPWALICVQAYDLAITQKKQSSYFAGVTLLYDPEKNTIFVADAWHDKFGFAEQARVIVNEARKWQPDRIAIEETGYQSSLREYIMELTEEPLPLFPVKPGSMSKEMRLTETLPMFEAGRVYFNPKLNPGAHTNLMRRGDIVSQLLNFVQSPDKDLGDAFAYGVRVLRSYRLEAADEDWDGGEGVHSRLSIIGS